MEKCGFVLICDLAALTRAHGRIGPGIPRGAQNGDTQMERSPKSRHQSNRLLRREHERLVRDSVREQRQVARLLAAAVSPSCGGTQLRTSATPRTFQQLTTVVASTSSGLKKNEDHEEKPQRHWTSVSNAKTTTDGNAAESCNIDRKPPDGILLIVPVVIQGKIFKALIDSGATRCFVSPSCMTVAGLQGRRSDTFLVLANGQRVLS